MQLLRHHYPNLPVAFLEQLNDRYALTGAQLNNINKKIMVEQLLLPETDLMQLLERFSAEELSTLSKNKPTPIGFLSKAS